MLKEPIFICHLYMGKLYSLLYKIIFVKILVYEW